MLASLPFLMVMEVRFSIFYILPKNKTLNIYIYKGDSVAKYCSKHLHNHIFQSDAFKQENYKEAIVDAYFGIDDEMLKGKRREGFLYKEL
jgi:hypothetical protein